MPENRIAYCRYPDAFVYRSDDTKKIAKHLFWGDTVEIRGGKSGKFIRVYSRDVTGFMHEDDLQPEPLLDIIFLDVGQGDSCMIVTPNDDKILIDAGKHDNLKRYLKWRYKNFSTETLQRMTQGKIKTIIISHFDSDHYGGLKCLYEKDEFFSYFQTKRIFHNGLFFIRQKSGDEYEEAMRPCIKRDGIEYFNKIILKKADLENLINRTEAKQLTDYLKVLSNIVKKSNDPDLEIQMLFAGSDAVNELIAGNEYIKIEILGPDLMEKQGEKLLRKYDGDLGIQKNGHSIILKIKYRNISILLPGDINGESEAFLLERYGGDPAGLRSDVYKVAHHGSSKFSDDFLYSVRPYACVISSGDNEQYSHPRPDTLGILGKAGRGQRPLIFCTELARSAAEQKKTPEGLRAQIDAAIEESASADTQEKKDMLKKLIDKLEKSLNRSISVYGAVNLRTDGTKILFSQKLEAKKDNMEWDIYCLEPGPEGLQLIRRRNSDA